MPRKTGSKNKEHKEYICPKCNKNFGCQKYMYNLHINKKFPCKNKMINDNDNDNDNNNENNNLKNNDLLDKINFLIKQNEEFKEKIKLLESNNDKLKILEEDNKKLKKKIILIDDVNTNTNYNNCTFNIQINNFNNMDYSKVDKKHLINTILQNTGKQIYIKAIENLFVNPEKPR